MKPTKCSRALCAVAAALTALSGNLAVKGGTIAPTVLHVDAERGDDAGDGSAARPFKTPAKAKDAVRTLKKVLMFPRALRPELW